MTIDELENLLGYQAMLPALSAGMEGLEKRKGDFQEGEQYPFQGGFLKFQRGKTKPLAEGTFEAHRKYADVQILLEGCEEMAWQPLEKLTEAIPYDAGKDMARYDGDRSHHMLIGTGMFYIAFPKDGHKAVSHVGSEPHDFVKCIMKVEL